MRTYTLTIAMMFAAWAAPEGSTPDVDLARLSMLSAPSGYEGSLRVVIRKSLPKGVASRVDNLGSLIIEGGKGSPHRLFVTSLDEPGLVVSRITPDGYLRLSPLGGIGPGGLDLRFFEGKRVVVRGKDGWIPGAVTATSIHLRGKRPERFSIDDVWVDIGASSRDEAEAAGITRLAPLTLTKQFRSLAGTQVTGVALSHRFGCQVLLELAHRWSDSPPAGKWTIAWAAQDLIRGRGVLFGRGVQRLAQQVEPDEVYYVGRVAPRRAPDSSPGLQDQFWYPDSELGAGPVVLSVKGEVPALAEAEGIQRIKGAGRDPTRAFPGAEQRHILSIPILYPDTPAEIIDTRDLDALIALILSLTKEDR